MARRVFDYLLLGQWPSEEDLALVRQGRAGAPVGTPRRAEAVALPGLVPPLAQASPVPATAPRAAPAAAQQVATGKPPARALP